MAPKSDTTGDQLKILIVDENTRLGSILKEELNKHESEIFVSPRPPENLQIFNWSFIINPHQKDIDRLCSPKDTSTKHIVFIFFGHIKKSEELAERTKGKRNTLKFITIDHPESVDSYDLEKILWFTFSKSSENIFHIRTQRMLQPQKPPSPPFRFPGIHIKIKPKAVPFIILAILLIAHLLFIPPLILASFNLYKGAKALSQKNFTQTLSYASRGQQWTNVSKNLYGLARPALSLFSAASFTDDLFQVNDTTASILQDSQKLYQDSASVMALLFKKQKSQSEIQILSSQGKNLDTQINALDQKITFLQNKLPDFSKLTPAKKELQKTLDAVQIAEKIIPHFDSIFAKGTEKTYLLLFANNMELRPGGGFIGSFGIVKVTNYTIEDIKVYDVYDADGQLTEHIDPPEAIRNYLDQPNWFLRDSAFSPDFLVDYNQAKEFLQKELGFTNIDGSVLLTTTTIQNILGAVGELYIPDYQEKVNKDNFYLKAQLYAEKNFFPGSIQKKQFLGAVTDQLLLKLENSFSPAVLQSFKKSLDEKQMVFQMGDPDLQQTIDSLYWSGRVIQPFCTNSGLEKNCINDYLFSYDANLGVNKANFYVKRSQNIKVSLKKDGSIHNTYTLTLRNEAANEAFPGGTYKNYLQIMLPKGAIIKSVTKNDSLVDRVDSSEGIYKSIGFLVEIPPQHASTIVVSYDLPQKISSGQGQYQLIVQKQIGSSNSDFQVSIEMPGNYHISRKNFTGLVKDHEILYNTSLSADKIFLLELIKE